MKKTILILNALLLIGCAKGTNIVEVRVDLIVTRDIAGMIAEEYIPDDFSPLQPIQSWRFPQSGIREVIATDYDFKGESGFEKQYMTGYTVTTFDESGDLLTELSYESDDFISYSKKYDYEDGNLTTFSATDFFEDLSFSLQYQYENGMLISEQEAELVGTEVMDWSSTEYVYEDGLLVSKISYDTNGNIAYRYEMLYDESNRLIAMIGSEEGAVDYEVDYTYSNVLLTAVTRYNSDGDEVYQYLRKYNEYDQLSQEMLSRSGALHTDTYSVLRIRQYEYNEDGNVESVYYHNDLNGEVEQGNVHFTYDDQGVLSNEKMTTISGDPVSMTEYGVQFYDWIEDAL